MAGSELVELDAGCWVLPGPTNLGLVETPEGVLAVDSGNDKDAAKRLVKAAEAKGLAIKAVVSTHSNADHIGGNAYLQETKGCELWASPLEAAFIEAPVLEPSLLWGGLPPRELRTKFFEAKASRVDRRLSPGPLGDGLEVLSLPGHFPGQLGLLVRGRVLFAGDALFGPAILEKHPIPFLYDPAAFLGSLEVIRERAPETLVPSHGEPTRDPEELVSANARRVQEIEDVICGVLAEPRGFDEILAVLLGTFSVVLDHGQYALVGSTLRSFLSYLCLKGAASLEFEDNRARWRGTKGLGQIA